MKEKYGFVYIWYDRKRKMYYIGSHWGTSDDGYICSSNRMRDAYRRRPTDFKRRIIWKTNVREELLQEEEKWLQKIKRKKSYYNYRYTVSVIQYPIKHWAYDSKKRNDVASRISKKLTGTSHSPERSEKNKNRVHSEESKQKMSKSHIGLKHGEEAKKKMSEARIGNQYGKGSVRSEEFKNNVSKFHTGKKNSPETIEKMRQAKIDWWAKKKVTQL